MTTNSDNNSGSSFKKPNLYKPNDPPLVSFQVTNPVSYFKLWFKKVWANEGIVLHLRIKPLTIIALALLFTGTGLGISKTSIPFYSYIFGDILLSPTPTAIPLPTVTPNPWVEAAYAGILHKSDTSHFYLVIPSGEAISLEIPLNINLSDLSGKRILAYGTYNPATKTLRVINASDMEILPLAIMSVPTSSLPTKQPD